MLRACPHHGFMELTQIDTFYNGLNENDQDSLNAAAGRNILSKTTREALNIIENKSKVCYLRNKSNVSRVNTTSKDSSSKTDKRIDKLTDQISTLVEIVSKKVVTPTTVKAVEESCVICGGPHAYYNCITTDSGQSSVCAATGTYNQVAPQNRASNHMEPPGFAPVQNNSQNSDVAYEGHSIPTNHSTKKVVEQETKEITDKEQTNFQGSTAHIQPLVVPILEPNVSKTLPKPNIPYPLRINDQKLHVKATNQMEKFFQIFQDFHFDISFADALLLMPKFTSRIKSLLANKDNNQPSVCVATGTYNQVAPQNRASNYMAPPGFALVQNNQNRFNQNQGEGINFNRGNNFQPFQVPNQGFQNQPFQVPNNPVQQGFSNKFLNYKKVNDQMIRSMQNQINSLKREFKNEIQNRMKTQQTVLMEQQNAFQNNLQNMLSGFFQNQSLTSGTLPSNTIPNLKGEMKEITTRSGVAYEGPLIHTLKIKLKVALSA
nr:reverse transcriptase domain-containing protein [Tanacetum cinerariifolium]